MEYICSIRQTLKCQKKEVQFLFIAINNNRGPCCIRTRDPQVSRPKLYSCNTNYVIKIDTNHMQFKQFYKVLLVTCIQYGNKTEVKGVRGPLIDKHLKSYLYDLNTYIYTIFHLPCQNLYVFPKTTFETA